MAQSMLGTLELARNAYGRLVRESLRELGIDPREAVVLRMAARNQRLTIGDVRTTAGMPASTVSSVVKRLVKDELIVRYPLPGDRRHVLLYLTRLGEFAARNVDSTIDDIAVRLADARLADADSLADVSRALFELVAPRWADPLA